MQRALKYYVETDLHWPNTFATVARSQFRKNIWSVYVDKYNRKFHWP